MNTPDFVFEKKLWRRGYSFVAGVDEVGRGSFSGPVVAGCVVFDHNMKEIEAKIKIDKLMVDLSKKANYKKYGWDRNKGYGTKEHRDAILKYGITRLHRKDFVD